MAPTLSQSVEKLFCAIDPGISKIKNEYECRFCPKKYSHHITRMTKHILEFCEKCPDKEKADLLKLSDRKRSSTIAKYSLNKIEKLNSEVCTIESIKNVNPCQANQTVPIFMIPCQTRSKRRVKNF